MWGQAGYSTRNNTDTPSRSAAQSPADPAAGLKASNALSSFIAPETTVLYCMRS
jgi:hypothetical protein